MIKIDDYPLVKITWVDAKDGLSGWEEIQEIINYDLATVVDVGWMVAKDSQKIVIMGSFCTSDEDPQEGGRYTAIPTSWVTKVEYLKIDKVKVIQ
jgi:hypothetical protein